LGVVFLQLYITVTDMGPIPKSSGYFLIVNVNRNLYAPVHNQQVWNLQINEDQSVGSVIQTIGGYDNDTKVSYLELLFQKTRNVPFQVNSI